MKWQDMRAQLQKTRQIIVPGQMRTNLRDDDSKLVGRGKLERQLLAVFVVELLRAANGEQLYSDCGGTASRRFLLVLAHAGGEIIGPFSGTSLVAAGATGTCAAEGGAVDAAQPAAAA